VFCVAKPYAPRAPGSLFLVRLTASSLPRLVRGARCRQLLLRGAKNSRSYVFDRVGARACSNAIVCNKMACLLASVLHTLSYASQTCRTNRRLLFQCSVATRKRRPLRLYGQEGVSKEVSEVSEVRRCHVVDLRPLELLFLRHCAEAVEIDLRGNRVEGEKLRREMTRGTTMTTIM
jgi:hypothetical protein